MFLLSTLTPAYIPQPKGWGLGGQRDKNSRWFDGLMDEFYMFARALSEDEIKEVMEREFLSVQPADKLATTWDSLKSRR